MAGARGLIEGFAGAVAGRDRSLLAPVCAPDVHYEDPLTREALSGCEALADHFAQVWVGFPAASAVPAGELLEDGRFVAAPLRLTGRHTGEVGGLPATGRAVALHAILWCELDPPRERLWRIRAFYDLYDGARQLGVLPPHGGVGERAMLMLRGFGLFNR